MHVYDDLIFFVHSLDSIMIDIGNVGCEEQKKCV
jgi:hypothetical protein